MAFFDTNIHKHGSRDMKKTCINKPFKQVGKIAKLEKI